MGDADGSNVKIARRGHILADRHVDTVALERRFFTEIPPEIDEVPRHPSVLGLFGKCHYRRQD